MQAEADHSVSSMDTVSATRPPLYMLETMKSTIS